MSKITNFTDELGNEVVIIENEDGSTTTITKSFYDEQQAVLEKPKK